MKETVRLTGKFPLLAQETREKWGTRLTTARAETVELCSTGQPGAAVPTCTLSESQFVIEPERYELRAGAPYRFDLDRREFFKFLGAGVLVVSVLKPAVTAQESGGSGRRHGGDSLPKEIDAWMHINDSGRVTVYTGKAEMGQNIRTSLTQAVAEELHVSMDKIELVMGDTDLTPFDMGTFGSRTTPTMNLQLRRVAAAARDTLMGLAAAQWKTDVEHLIADDGKVKDPKTNRTIEYAALTKGQQLTETLPAEDPLIPAASWKVAGQSVAKVDGRDFMTGKHRYPSDQKLPGMLYGKVLRPPAFDATLVSVDTKKAERMGATVVHDGNFVGVAAASAEQARAAVEAIHAEWKSDPQISNKELFDYFRKNTTDGSDPTGDGDSYEAGKIDPALAAADHKLQQTYTVSYIAHVPLEPRAALAKWDGDKLTVWTGTQRPFGVRGQLAEAFRMPEDQVRVLMPDTGSGYGGKHTGETAIEAARLARAAKRPVKVVWTREEEFTWAYFRPAGVMDVTSGVRADGTITAWEFHNYNSGSAGIRSYYEIPNQRIVFHPTKTPLRQGSYRALAATANHFARESHMDELAHAVKMDPLEFRLKNLKDERLRAVFQAAAKQFGWGKAKGEGSGFGMGGGYEKLGYIATFAEVHVDRKLGDVKIVRVVSAFDCGAVVNPDGLRNQIEGSNVQGLGGALFEAIQFENGKILNGRLSQYRVPRFSDAPALETVLLDRKDEASVGAGECPMIGLAPAIANAIFDAVGVRLRALPMAPNGLKGLAS
jgi:nicotinate dehydrogenase subunit B